MTVNGSSVAYQHSALGWMNSTNVFTCSSGSMTWYMMKHVGCSVIYRFQKCESSVISDPMPLALRLTDDTVYGEPEIADLGESMKVSALSTRLLVMPWGSSVLVKVGTRDLIIPKWLVAEARLACLFAPRNKDTFQLVVRKLKEIVRRKDVPIL